MCTYKNRIKRKCTFSLPSGDERLLPVMDEKAKILLTTALVESKLPSVLMLSLITNTFLMLKLLELHFLSCYSLHHETVPTPLLISLNGIITYRWRNCDTAENVSGSRRAEQGQLQECVPTGWPFSFPSFQSMWPPSYTKPTPWRWAIIIIKKLQRKPSLHTINGILTFITTYISCGCGNAPVIIWAVPLLLNKIGPGSVFKHWLLLRFEYVLWSFWPLPNTAL